MLEPRPARTLETVSEICEICKVVETMSGLKLRWFEIVKNSKLDFAIWAVCLQPYQSWTNERQTNLTHQPACMRSPPWVNQQLGHTGKLGKFKRERCPNPARSKHRYRILQWLVWLDSWARVEKKSFMSCRHLNSCTTFQHR